MQILYNSEDLKRILIQHHSYSREPIKVGGYTQDVLTVAINADEVIVTIGKEPEDEE